MKLDEHFERNAQPHKNLDGRGKEEAIHFHDSSDSDDDDMVDRKEAEYSRTKVPLSHDSTQVCIQNRNGCRLLCSRVCLFAPACAILAICHSGRPILWAPHIMVAPL